MLTLDDLFAPINYRSDPEYVEAETWYDTVTKQATLSVTDDSFTLAYSVSRYEELARSKEHIEDKADALLKFVSTVAGAMVAALVAISKTGEVGQLGRLCIPSFVMLGLVALLCLQMRQTVLWPSPFDPKSTIDMALAKYSEDRIRAIAVAANHCSVVGARYVVKRFAQRLNFAFHLTGIAVLLLSLLAFA